MKSPDFSDILLQEYGFYLVGAASSRDHAIMAIEKLFFRGWKPLSPGIDVKLMTLT
jgi:hypothetical protein